MIDTIKIKKYISQDQRNALLHAFAKKTQEGKLIYYPSENKAIINRYKNLTLNLGENNLTISGSLTKMHYGNNLKQLTFNQVRDLFKSLEAVLSISLDDAMIKRIDVACNIPLNTKASSYLSTLATPKGYKLCHYENETKYFENGNNTYCVYDKGRELKAKTGQNLGEKNLLRYELRFIKNLATQFSWKNSTLSNLYDAENYIKMIACFWSSFCKIPFGQNYSDLPFDLTSVKNLKKKLMVDGIKYNGGTNKLLSEIKSVQVKRETRYWIRKMIDSLPVTGANNKDLINELGTKISAVCQKEVYAAIHYSYDSPLNSDDSIDYELPEDDDARN